jgi:alpha/beta superfamily hydrolase
LQEKITEAPFSATGAGYGGLKRSRSPIFEKFTKGARLLKLISGLSGPQVALMIAGDRLAMKSIRIVFLLAGLIFAAVVGVSGAQMNGAQALSQQLPAASLVTVTASDGTALKASYFAAGKPGPGVLLFHQSNRDRKSWDEVAKQLAAAGINTLTLDLRGYGESGGKKDATTQWLDSDLDAALTYLAAQPGVTHDVIGLGGAGWLGVNSSVEAARRHSAQVKSLALLSGDTMRENLQFLHQSPQLPGLFVVSDDDEYPPTQDTMKLLYISSSSPSKKFVHYSAAQDAVWLWYETSDVSKVPARGGHGTDLFQLHPELSGIIVNWFVTTLIKTPGHALADTEACAPIIDEIRMPGGVEKARRRLLDARQKDPKAQLWPEVTFSIIAQEYLSAGDRKPAVQISELNLLAYSDSADAEDSLADAYLADGQKDLARQHAEKTLALLDAHTSPASSWSDSEPRRSEIRRDAEQILKTVSGTR